MNVKKKYFLFNIIWILVLGAFITMAFLIKIEFVTQEINRLEKVHPNIISILMKLYLCLFIISSSVTYVNSIDKDETDFDRYLYEKKEFFYGSVIFLVVLFILIILLHCLFDYKSIDLNSYFSIFSLLIAALLVGSRAA